MDAKSLDAILMIRPKLWWYQKLARILKKTRLKLGKVSHRFEKDLRGGVEERGGKEHNPADKIPMQVL